MNHAALSPDDVADARRGHPAVDLRDYAAARQLDHRGQALLGPFAGLNPRFADYTFNVMHGELPGRRHGVVQHDLIEIRLHQGGSHSFQGGLFGVRATTNWGWKALVHLDQQDEETPFADHYLYVPTTTVMVEVPEAVFVPRLSIRPAEYVGMRPRRLGPHAPDFAVADDEHVDDALLAAIDAWVGPTLTTSLGPCQYAEAALRYGRLRLRVNGFVGDAAHLDHLVNSTTAIADGLVEVGRGWQLPTSFEQALPAFDAGGHPAGWPSANWMNRFDDSLLGHLATIADDLGLVVEDPVMLHRAFPSLPLPGASIGVVAGTPLDARAPGRLTWQFPGHWRGAAYRWGAAIFAAAPDAPATPPAGGWWEPTRMWVRVRDGLACCWTNELIPGHFHSREIAERALTTMRATGAAAV